MYHIENDEDKVGSSALKMWWNGLASSPANPLKLNAMLIMVIAWCYSW